MAPKPEDHLTAEILLWQGRYRVVVLPLIGFSTVVLKWFDVIASDSLFAAEHGARRLLIGVLGILLTYLVSHRLMAWYLRRAGHAGMAAVLVTIASDILAIFAVIALITPPEHYDRALIVSVFSVQLTQVFFGWTATLFNLAMIAFAYTGLIAFAAAVSTRIAPSEELWTLALYVIGVLAYVALQGYMATRMRRLVGIFTRAQEGDFSQRFEEDPDQMPDPITMIGRAYNRMRSHLETIVLTDPLSGCFNRRGLNQLAEREVSRAVRGKKDIAVLAIDIDHFKAINDQFGHLTGDEVIREVGGLLRETAREPDVVARIGGEEFTILAPESNEEGAMILAERVMAAFRTHAWRSLPAEYRLTASVGVAASAARDDDVAKTLLARADEALYIAKRNGRDRAVPWVAGMRAFDGSIGGRASVPGMLR